MHSRQMNTSTLFLLILIFFSNAVYADYFLSWPQKGGLLLNGGVTDTVGNEYNVTIVPGYLSMLNFSGNEWVKGWKIQTKGGIRLSKGLLRIPLSLKHFHDYITPVPWQGIYNGFEQTCSGEKFLFTDYMGTGVAETWKTYFGRAQNAHIRKSFGWWFAYPWATIKGTVNTALRYVTGIPASAIVATYGICLRPVWEITFPVLKTSKDVVVHSTSATYGVCEASWGLIVNQALFGVATPVSGYVWNTAVGVPMALFGRAPTPQSADGWWVVLTSEYHGKRILLFPDTATIVTVVKQYEQNKKIEFQCETLNRQLDSIVRPYQEERGILLSQVDSLDRIIADKKLYFKRTINHLKDSTRALRISARQPDSTATFEWEQNEKDSLQSYILTIVKQLVTDTSLLDIYEQHKLANNLVSSWTWIPYKYRIRKKVEKQDPNRLIQTEMEEILK